MRFNEQFPEWPLTLEHQMKAISQAYHLLTQVHYGLGEMIRLHQSSPEASACEACRDHVRKAMERLLEAKRSAARYCG